MFILVDARVLNRRANVNIHKHNENNEYPKIFINQRVFKAILNYNGYTVIPILIRTLYVSNINTDRRVELFESLFHTHPRANYNSICSPRSIIHLLRQVKLIGKSGELHWEDYLLKPSLLLIVGADALTHKLSVLGRLQCVHDPQRSTPGKDIVFPLLPR